jgi:hypothetical protein
MSYECMFKNQIFMVLIWDIIDKHGLKSNARTMPWYLYGISLTNMFEIKKFENRSSTHMKYHGKTCLNDRYLKNVRKFI